MAARLVLPAPLSCLRRLLCRWQQAPLSYKSPYSTKTHNQIKLTSLLSINLLRRWVAERKKFFPTSESVARKAAEAAARRERGELDPAR